MHEDVFDLGHVNFRFDVDTTGAVLALNKAVLDLTMFRWRSIGAAQAGVSRRVAMQKVLRVRSLFLVGVD